MNNATHLLYERVSDYEKASLLFFNLCRELTAIFILSGLFYQCSVLFQILIKDLTVYKNKQFWPTIVSSQCRSVFTTSYCIANWSFTLLSVLLRWSFLRLAAILESNRFSFNVFHGFTVRQMPTHARSEVKTIASEWLPDVSRFSVYSRCLESSGSTAVKMNETSTIKKEMWLLSKPGARCFWQTSTRLKWYCMKTTWKKPLCFHTHKTYILDGFHWTVSLSKSFADAFLF